MQPIDFVGEILLGEGRFTYVLTIHDLPLPIGSAMPGETVSPDGLDIRVEKD